MTEVSDYISKEAADKQKKLEDKAKVFEMTMKALAEDKKFLIFFLHLLYVSGYNNVAYREGDDPIVAIGRDQKRALAVDLIDFFNMIDKSFYYRLIKLQYEQEVVNG